MIEIKDILYKLAIWYIGRYNYKYDKPTNDVYSLDRLTFRNADKAYLSYGADVEWKNFSRYNVIDNAIQRLAMYEDAEEEMKRFFQKNKKERY